jgi:hypothetical protein
MILNTDLGSWEEDNFRVTCFNGNKLFVVGSLLNMFLFSLGGRGVGSTESFSSSPFFFFF